MGRTQRTIDGAAGAPLSKRQKAALAQMARKAYDVQAGLGLAEGSFDDWRRAAVWEHLRLSGFRQMTQRGYGTMAKRFTELAGGKQQPRAARRGPDVDDSRRAWYALKAECAALAEAFGGADSAEAYAEAILGRVHKTTPEGATARQVWQTLYTLRNRANAKRRKGDTAAPGAPEPANGQKRPKAALTLAGGGTDTNEEGKAFPLRFPGQQIDAEGEVR